MWYFLLLLACNFWFAADNLTLCANVHGCHFHDEWYCFFPSTNMRDMIAGHPPSLYASVTLFMIILYSSIWHSLTLSGYSV